MDEMGGHMGLDILGIAESALSAFQVGVAVSSKNIADSSDPDYCREIVECSSMMGGELNVDVKRISDHFLGMQLYQTQAELNKYTASSSVLSSIDQFVTGLNGSNTNGPYNLITQNMQNFFDSLNTLSTSINDSTKESVISQANLLASTLKGASDYVNQQKDNTDLNISNTVSQINSLTQQIAILNEKFEKVSGTPSPDLLDQRDKLVSQLSQYVGIRTSEVNGMTNVSLMNGSSLVGGTSVSKIGVQHDPFENKTDITLSGSVLSSPETLSGTLAGLVDTRNNLIPKIQEKIGLFSATLIAAFNKQNAAGYVSANTHGGNIFQPVSSEGVAANGNQGNAQLSVTIDPANIGNLEATSYTVTQIGTGQYQVTNDATGVITSGFTSFPISINGLTIAETSGAMHDGDSFKIDPLAQAASSISVAAGPNDIALSDQSDGTGNGNINALANLANQKIFAGSTNSFSGQLGNIFADIGTMTSGSSQSLGSAKAAYTQASNDKQSLSGVNTQEEYTNIIHFQQSYAAAAKVITVDQQMFTTMLSVLGD